MCAKHGEKPERAVDIHRFEQLLQIFDGATWDDFLISKEHRDFLVRAGLVERTEYGYNIITPKGVKYAVETGLVNFWEKRE